MLLFVDWGGRRATLEAFFDTAPSLAESAGEILAFRNAASLPALRPLRYLGLLPMTALAPFFENKLLLL